MATFPIAPGLLWNASTLPVCGEMCYTNPIIIMLFFKQGKHFSNSLSQTNL